MLFMLITYINCDIFRNKNMATITQAHVELMNISNH